MSSGVGKYSEKDATMDKVLLERNLKIVKEFREICSLAKGKVLDLGCGNGYWNGALWSDINYRYTSPKDKNYGIDPRINKNFPGIFIVGVAEDISFEDNFFDSVVCHTSLQHFQDYYKSFEECFRVLKEGGWLFHSIGIRNDCTYNKEIILNDGNDKNDHKYLFSIPTVLELFKSTGFKNISKKQSKFNEQLFYFWGKK